MKKFKTQTLSKDQSNQTHEHLRFIQHMTNESLKYSMRTIIGGGYAIDGLIGMLTRPHNDVDIQLYGKEVVNEVYLKERFLNNHFKNCHIENHGMKGFYQVFFVPSLGAEIYYIRVATNPFSDSKIVIRNDGIYSEEHSYDSKMVFLNGFRFEAQSAETELVDKIFKREHRGDQKQKKHEQDIYNLRLIASPQEVTDRLKKLTS